MAAGAHHSLALTAQSQVNFTGLVESFARRQTEQRILADITPLTHTGILYIHHYSIYLIAAERDRPISHTLVLLMHIKVQEGWCDLSNQVAD